ncbi:MAG: hypothetical protein ACYTKD_21815, partial [Planctomycetota bacterium]
GAGRGEETRRTEFDVSRLTQEVAKAVGTLGDVRASVVLFDRKTQKQDGTWEYTSVEQDLASYKKLAVRALGVYDEDAVEVQYMPSARAEPAVEDARPLGPDVLAWAAGAAATALAVALVVAVVVAFARMVRRRGAPPAEAVAALPEEAPGLPASERLRRDVARAAAEDVGRTAAILRRWIAREG